MPRIAVNRGILVIRTRLMEIMGWTRADFDRALREGMPVESRPENKGGEYLLYTGDVINWLVRRAVAEATGDAPDAQDEAAVNGEREKALLLREQRIKTAFENAILNKEYVKAADVEMADAVVYAALRDRIRAVAASAAPLLRDAAVDGGETKVKLVLEEHLDEALQGLGNRPVVTDVAAVAAGEAGHA